MSIPMSASDSLESVRHDTTDGIDEEHEWIRKEDPEDKDDTALSSSSPRRSRLTRTMTNDLARNRDCVRRNRVTRMSEDHGTTRTFTISPISPLRLVWDVVIILITIISGIITPMVLVYFERLKDSNNSLDMLLYVIDCFWVIDVVVNLRTGFFKHGDVVYDGGRIAKHYASGWMFPDLLTTWPLYAMRKDGVGYVVACFLKSPRLLQLGSRFLHLQSGTLSDRLLPTGIVVASVLGTHFLACMWRATVNWDAHGCTFSCFAVDAEDSWITQYVKDMYFVSMTLTSVGYGDITAKSSISRCVAIFFMLLGSAVFGACVSGCSIIFHSLIEDEVSNKTAEITRFMARRSVPQTMQRRVRDNLRQCLSSSGANSSMVPFHILENLSPSMRRELSLCLVSDIFHAFPLFRNTQQSFLADLAQAQYWQHVLPGDLVADQGQAVQEIVFVMTGELEAIIDAAANGQMDQSVQEMEVMKAPSIHSQRGSSSSSPGGSSSDCFASHDRKSDEILRLPRGSWIGEASLLSDIRIYTAIITAVCKSELSILPASEYVRIVQSFPRLLERHIRMKRSIQAGNSDYASLAYRQQMNTMGTQNSRLSITSRMNFMSKIKRHTANLTHTLHLDRISP